MILAACGASKRDGAMLMARVSPADAVDRTAVTRMYCATIGCQPRRGTPLWTTDTLVRTMFVNSLSVAKSVVTDQMPVPPVTLADMYQDRHGPVKMAPDVNGVAPARVARAGPAD